jgi:hypothetical protein
MADYQLMSPDPNGPVLRRADGAYIPSDPANADWIEYQNWLALGNVPDPYVPPITEPVRDANTRLDDGVLAAQDIMSQPPASFIGPQTRETQAEFDALKAQVNQLQAAVKAMLEAHGLP